jgi:hypothetical protein
MPTPEEYDAREQTAAELAATLILLLGDKTRHEQKNAIAQSLDAALLTRDERHGIMAELSQIEKDLRGIASDLDPTKGGIPIGVVAAKRIQTTLQRMATTTKLVWENLR